MRGNHGSYLPNCHFARCGEHFAWTQQPGIRSARPVGHFNIKMLLYHYNDSDDRLIYTNEAMAIILLALASALPSEIMFASWTKYLPKIRFVIKFESNCFSMIGKSSPREWSMQWIVGLASREPKLNISTFENDISGVYDFWFGPKSQKWPLANIVHIHKISFVVNIMLYFCAWRISAIASGENVYSWKSLVKALVYNLVVSNHCLNQCWPIMHSMNTRSSRDTNRVVFLLHLRYY